MSQVDLAKVSFNLLTVKLFFSKGFAQYFLNKVFLPSRAGKLPLGKTFLAANIDNFSNKELFYHCALCYSVLSCVASCLNYILS